MGTLMPNEAVVAVHRYARATNRRVLAGRLLQGTALAAGGLAAAVLIARTLSWYLSPSWWWALAALPAAAWAAFWLRREAMTTAAAAVHLDQRLGLDGLLLTATANPGALAARFASRVARALPDGAAAVPRLRYRRLLPPPLLAGLVLVATAMVPAPERERQRSLPSVQAEVERLADRLARLERGHLPELAGEELRERVAALRDELDGGGVPEWSELDRLSARLEHEALQQQLRAEELARAATALDAAGADAAAAPQALAAAAAALLQAGELGAALGSLPPELLQQLADALGAADLDPAGLDLSGVDLAGLQSAFAGLDAAALAQLAAALRSAAGEGGLQAGAPGQALDAEARQRLAELLAQRPRAGHEHGPECAGGT